MCRLMLTTTVRAATSHAEIIDDGLDDEIDVAVGSYGPELETKAPFVLEILENWIACLAV